MTKPDKICSYPIPHDDTGGSLHLFGNVNAPHLVIMCPGFPDDHSVFHPLAARIASTCNCLVGVTCLPGYDDGAYPDRAWKDGFSFIEWASCVREAVKTLRKQSVSKDAKLTGIFHDWGCLTGVMYTNQAIFADSKELIPDQVVLFDVLATPHPKETNVPKVDVPKLQQAYIGLVLFSYQIVFANTWLLQRYVSDYLAAAHLGLGSLLLFILRLNPISLQDYTHAIPIFRYRLFQAMYMAYPYFNLWKVIFTGKIRETFPGAYLPRDLERTPILFLYGGSKNAPLHKFNSLALLEQEWKMGNRSRAVCIEKAGHWLYLQEPDTCFENVKTFLEELVPVSRL